MPMIEDRHVPTRATYFNLYKWPESDVKFLKSIISGEGQARAEPDVLACRQLYLRSYTFSKEEDNCKNINCLRLLPKRRKKLSCRGVGGGAGAGAGARRAVYSLCRRMLSCTFKIHVQD